VIGFRLVKSGGLSESSGTTPHGPGDTGTDWEIGSRYIAWILAGSPGPLFVAGIKQRERP
jgi:hypothetical protein